MSYPAVMPEVASLMAVSSSHVTEADHRRLLDCRSWTCEPFAVFVDEADDHALVGLGALSGRSEAGVNDECAAAGLMSLGPVAYHALRAGARYLLLDGDGPEVVGLPAYDW